jgi:ABC-type uncharacterized transport system substrate-binding protein
MLDVNRREFIALVGGASTLLAAKVNRARGQQPAVPVIGVLSAEWPDRFTDRLRAFHGGLRETGYVDGRNLAIEYRWAEGRNDRLPALAAELVRRQVSVIVTAGSTPAALAARAATTTIPIVFYLGADPVDAGLVTSLSRPGGNVTGVVTLNVEVAPKRLELLHELVPTARIIAALINPTNPVLAETLTRDLQTAAHTLGVQLHILHDSACEQRTGVQYGLRIAGPTSSRGTRDWRRRIVQQPERTPGRADDPARGARDLPVSRVCISWRPDELRNHRCGHVPSTRHLHRSNSER